MATSSRLAGASAAASITDTEHAHAHGQPTVPITPRLFCQEQLLMLGDEELLPTAQAATLEILHSTIMKDPDAAAFEARLRVLAAASHAAGTAVGAAAPVAQGLLEAWHQAQREDR
jgi:hypothetical protein